MGKHSKKNVSFCGMERFVLESRNASFCGLYREDFAKYEGMTVNVKTNRTFKAGNWGTFSVPFDVPEAVVKELFGDTEIDVLDLNQKNA